jgi:hypothetical protein
MAIQVRAGRYVYRKTRRGGRLTTEYLGTGPGALGEVLLATLERQRRIEARAERAELAETDALLADYCNSIQVVFHAAMKSAGFHQHRWSWRKRRMSRRNGNEIRLVNEQPDRDWADLSPAERQDLLRRANDGDESTARSIRAWLATAEPVTLRSLMGDLSQRCVDLIAQNQSDNNVLVREAITEHAARLRRQLAGEAPNPLEALLVERIVVCWVATHALECYAQRCVQAGLPDRAEAVELRLDRAHRRLLQAVRALALVRRTDVSGALLAINAQNMQVNIKP